MVALGGGMGLSASLAALRRITGDLTAVVTVADDWGLQRPAPEELGVLPPATCARRSPRSAATTTGARPGRG
ncbi:Gluconeogenesis factor [Streptomyces tanashiensis]